MPSSGPARGFEYTVSRVFYTKVFSISLPKFPGTGYQRFYIFKIYNGIPGERNEVYWYPTTPWQGLPPVVVT